MVAQSRTRAVGPINSSTQIGVGPALRQRRPSDLALLRARHGVRIRFVGGRKSLRFAAWLSRPRLRILFLADARPETSFSRWSPQLRSRRRGEGPVRPLGRKPGRTLSSSNRLEADRLEIRRTPRRLVPRFSRGLWNGAVVDAAKANIAKSLARRSACEPAASGQDAPVVARRSLCSACRPAPAGALSASAPRATTGRRCVLTPPSTTNAMDGTPSGVTT
jgi:hypothetical protein